MEQAEGQSSGNEETPYTVVVQIPNPYGDSSGIYSMLFICTIIFQLFNHSLMADPIYVFGSTNQSSDQTARMTQLYQAVNSVEVIGSSLFTNKNLYTQVSFVSPV